MYNLLFIILDRQGGCGLPPKKEKGGPNATSGPALRTCALRHHQTLHWYTTGLPDFAAVTAPRGHATPPPLHLRRSSAAGGGPRPGAPWRWAGARRRGCRREQRRCRPSGTRLPAGEEWIQGGAVRAGAGRGLGHPVWHARKQPYCGPPGGRVQGARRARGAEAAPLYRDDGGGPEGRPRGEPPWRRTLGGRGGDVGVGSLCQRPCKRHGRACRGL